MAVKKSSSKASTKDQEATSMTKEEAYNVYAPVFAMEGIMNKLASLHKASPQVLHVEGGSRQDRIATAHYYAALFFCEEGKEYTLATGERVSFLVPCGECDACYRVAAHLDADLLFYHKEEENEDLMRDFKVDSMRNLKVLVKEAPHVAKKRVVIFQEAESLQSEAANALLKVLEEPLEHTLFIFTASNRTRLLPTIVSRGFVLTLPWKETCSRTDFEEEWGSVLAEFFRHGTGLFQQTGQKNLVDTHFVASIVSLIQKSLARARLEKKSSDLYSDTDQLSLVFQSLEEGAFFEADAIIAKTVDAMQYLTNINYILDVLLTELFNLFPSR